MTPPEVARYVCAQVGLDAGVVVLGSEVDHLTDRDLAELARRTTVFAGADPYQKSRIVAALQAAGRTVGFVGDGVNDTAALRVADVGIGVNTATATARRAADLILPCDAAERCGERRDPRREPADTDPLSVQ